MSAKLEEIDEQMVLLPQPTYNQEVSVVAGKMVQYVKNGCVVSQRLYNTFDVRQDWGQVFIGAVPFLADYFAITSLVCPGVPIIPVRSIRVFVVFSHPGR